MMGCLGLGSTDGMQVLKGRGEGGLVCTYDLTSVSCTRVEPFTAFPLFSFIMKNRRASLLD